ncbi:MAG: nucleotidyltransferase domain-containing protein [Phormidesmis sp.]
MEAASVAKISSDKFRSYVAHRQRQKDDMRSRLQKRHQAGLTQAKALADILKSEFGATKVVLFGSMLSVNDIHMGSDIDLAVWNLPTKAYFIALSRLMTDVEEFSIDLVRIEEAPPSLSAYILNQGLTLGSDAPVSDTLREDWRSMASYTSLIGRIKRELGDIEAQYDQTRSQLDVARKTGQSAYWMAVSLGLHGIYTGFEKIFQQIAREVDRSLDKKSERWHKDLLEQMAANIPGAREAVIDEQTFRALEQYLSFRHVVRSNYAYRLEPKKIDDNFQILENCYQSLVGQLDTFCDFLLSID